MYFSVDRIVSGRAVLIGEDGKPLEVALQLLPVGTKQGDMLWYADRSFAPAPDKAAERREHVADMLRHLLQHGDEEE